MRLTFLTNTSELEISKSTDRCVTILYTREGVPVGVSVTAVLIGRVQHVTYEITGNVWKNGTVNLTAVNQYSHASAQQICTEEGPDKGKLTTSDADENWLKGARRIAQNRFQQFRSKIR